jgi:1-acyl-sn-glycerol-3-phosphate acyltransferase
LLQQKKSGHDYKLLKFLAKMILITVRRWEVKGRENLPSSGGSSWWQTTPATGIRLLLSVLSKKSTFYGQGRTIHYTGNRVCPEDFGSFPVRRDKSDREAIRTAVRLLEEGQVVGVFPEGTRSHTGELLKPHLGAAMLASKAKAPMVPIALIGTRGVFGKVKMIIGTPIVKQETKKSSKADLEKASDLVMDQIASMMKNN